MLMASKMESLFIILCAMTVIDSENWYPAEVTTRDTRKPDFVSFKNSSYSDFMKQRQYYLQHSVSTNEIRNNETDPVVNLRFAKPSDHGPIHTNVTEILKFKTFSTTNSTADRPHNTTLFEYNDASAIVYNVKSTKPKRKVLLGCRHPIRHKKQLNMNHTMKAKFLEVFEIMQIDHATCTSSSGLEGTCMHEYNCQAAGGATMGFCADGYGTCCVIPFVCDRRFSSPVGWFTSPGFPTPSIERLSCTVILDKISADIKQFRLDFLVFEMLPPASGTCEDDQFVVSGQNTNNFIPILCGVNTGQHVYIEVGDVDGPLLYISVQTITADTRLFAIKVTQLTNSDELAAPKGCLQFFKHDKGYMESFNYRDSSDIGISRYPGYLNNLNYAMCIERAPNTCSITYTNAGRMQISHYDIDGLPVIPPKQAGVEIFNCPSDWLLISAIRLCGERLNDGSVFQDFSLDAPVLDNGAGPIVVWFRSDGGYVGRGFKLYYLQNTCAV